MYKYLNKVYKNRKKVESLKVISTIKTHNYSEGAGSTDVGTGSTGVESTGLKSSS